MIRTVGEHYWPPKSTAPYTDRKVLGACLRTVVLQLELYFIGSVICYSLQTLLNERLAVASYIILTERASS